MHHNAPWSSHVMTQDKAEKSCYRPKLLALEQLLDQSSRGIKFRPETKERYHSNQNRLQPSLNPQTRSNQDALYKTIPAGNRQFMIAKLENFVPRHEKTLWEHDTWNQSQSAPLTFCLGVGMSTKNKSEPISTNIKLVAKKQWRKKVPNTRHNPLRKTTLENAKKPTQKPVSSNLLPPWVVAIQTLLQVPKTLQSAPPMASPNLSMNGPLE